MKSPRVHSRHQPSDEVVGLFSSWQILFLGMPLWWLLGLSPFIYHVAAIGFFFKVMIFADREGRSFFVPDLARPILFIICLYAFSLLVHAPKADFMRVLASLYSLSFWIAGFLWLIVMANAVRVFRPEVITRPFMKMAVCTSLFFCAVLMLWAGGLQAIEFPTPLYGISAWLGQTPLIENSLKIRMFYQDWFVSTQFPRLNLFAAYSTHSGGVLLVILLMLMAWLVLRRKTRNPFFILIFLPVLNANDK